MGCPASTAGGRPGHNVPATLRTSPGPLFDGNSDDASSFFSSPRRPARRHNEDRADLSRDLHESPRGEKNMSHHRRNTPPRLPPKRKERRSMAERGLTPLPPSPPSLPPPPLPPAPRERAERGEGRAYSTPRSKFTENRISREELELMAVTLRLAQANREELQRRRSKIIKQIEQDKGVYDRRERALSSPPHPPPERSVTASGVDVAVSAAPSEIASPPRVPTQKRAVDPSFVVRAESSPPREITAPPRVVQESALVGDIGISTRQTRIDTNEVYESQQCPRSPTSSIKKRTMDRAAADSLSPQSSRQRRRPPPTSSSEISSSEVETCSTCARSDSRTLARQYEQAPIRKDASLQRNDRLKESSFCPTKSAVRLPRSGRHTLTEPRRTVAVCRKDNGRCVQNSCESEEKDTSLSSSSTHSSDYQSSAAPSFSTDSEPRACNGPIKSFASYRSPLRRDSLRCHTPTAALPSRAARSLNVGGERRVGGGRGHDPRAVGTWAWWAGRDEVGAVSAEELSAYAPYMSFNKWCAGASPGEGLLVEPAFQSGVALVTRNRNESVISRLSRLEASLVAQIEENGATSIGRKGRARVGAGGGTCGQDVILAVNNCDIDALGCPALGTLLASPFLSELAHVTVLNISNNNIEDEGLGILLDALHAHAENSHDIALPALRELRLAVCGLRDCEGLFAALFHRPCLFPRLCVLDLAANPLSKGAFIDFIEGMSSGAPLSHRLERVDISSCNLPRSCVQVLSRFLTQERILSSIALKVLDCSGNRFGGSGEWKEMPSGLRVRL